MAWEKRCCFDVDSTVGEHRNRQCSYKTALLDSVAPHLRLQPQRTRQHALTNIGVDPWGVRRLTALSRISSCVLPGAWQSCCQVETTCSPQPKGLHHDLCHGPAAVSAIRASATARPSGWWTLHGQECPSYTGLDPTKLGQVRLEFLNRFNQPGSVTRHSAWRVKREPALP